MLTACGLHCLIIIFNGSWGCPLIAGEQKTVAYSSYIIMETQAACWSIGSACESLTVDDAKTMKSCLPICVDELHNIIAYSVYKINVTVIRAYNAYAHWSTSAFAKLEGFAVSAIWHIFYLATI